MNNNLADSVPSDCLGLTKTRLEIPSGPKNIDKYLYQNNLTGITWSDVDHYTIRAYGLLGGDDNLSPTLLKNEYSKLLTYKIKENCDQQFDHLRLTWLNSLGGWDYYSFKMIAEKKVNISKSNYRKQLPYNYTLSDRELTTYYSEADKEYTLNSDWITQDESDWLVDLFTSTNVYILNDIGEIRPVVVADNSYSYKTKGNQKLKQLTITIMDANKYAINV